MNDRDPWPILFLAGTVPVSFALIIISAAVRDRVLPGEVSGALVALLGVLAASTFAYYQRKKGGDDDA